MKEKHRYHYEGAIQIFDQLATQHWEADTFAVSPNRARNNLAYRFKRENGLAATAKVTLVGKIVKVEPKEV